MLISSTVFIATKIIESLSFYIQNFKHLSSFCSCEAGFCMTWSNALKTHMLSCDEAQMVVMIPEGP